MTVTATDFYYRHALPLGYDSNIFNVYSTLSDDMSVECLQACLHAISSWSDHWQLTLSPSKCTVLHVVAEDKCRARFSYSVAGHTLPVVESVTDLGVTYDNKLKFGPHIDKVCSKASSRAKLILKCFQTRSLYFAQSLLYFCPTNTRVCVCCMEPI